jgi:glycosyltransferase involved in cell wall biosynthesis
MYRERARLPATLMLLSTSALDDDETELLFVDDGSEDSSAQTVEHGAEAVGLRAEVIRLPHRGKGAAIAAGVRAAKGAVIAFVDADLSTGPADVDRCLRMVEDGEADVVVATRAHPDSEIGQRGPMSRQLWGRGYNRLLRTLDLTDMRDTQCGLKGFTADAAHATFGNLETDGFAFDIEVLARARRLGLRVTELPVHWTHMDESRVRPYRDAPHMLVDTLKIWSRTRALRPDALSEAIKDGEAPEPRAAAPVAPPDPDPDPA